MDPRRPVATGEGTSETPETGEQASVSTVSQVTARHPLPEARRMLEVSRATIYRYVSQYRMALTVEERDGHLWFSDEDMEFLRQVKQAKNDAARQRLAEAQRERVASLNAGLRRPEAEAVRRTVRQLAEGVTGVPRRIRLLLDHMPHLQGRSMKARVATYLATFHDTADMLRLEATDAPAPWTVERSWRRITKGG